MWRDEDGRLVWGVNDFDEAAEMPYPLDLARLVVSAVLAPGPWVADIDKICRTVLAGYQIGLEERKPFVLDRDHLWLRRQFEVDDDERDEFWMKIEKKRRKTKDAREDGKPPELYREILEARMLGGKKIMFWRSSAGPEVWADRAGSLMPNGEAVRSCVKPRPLSPRLGRSPRGAAARSAVRRSPAASIGHRTHTSKSLTINTS